MNRKLKFRAWDNAKAAWIEGGYGFHILGEAMLIGGLFHDYGLLELNNIVIDQFTGLKDKNGIDVYERDIIKHHKYGGEHAVKWIAESTGFFVGTESWPLTALCCPNIEVVANEHERAAKARRSRSKTKRDQEAGYSLMVQRRAKKWRDGRPAKQ